MHNRKSSGKQSAQRRRFTCESLESRTLLANVTLIKDIDTGTQSAYPAPVGQLGSMLFLSMTDNSGDPVLVKTNGTAAGTTTLTIGNITDVNQGVVFNGELLFPLSSGGNYLETTQFNGSFTGQVAQLNNGGINDGLHNLYAQHLTVVGSHVFFSIGETIDGSVGGTLWMTDVSSTQPFSQVAGNSAFDTDTRFAALGSKLICMTSQSQLWATDGTSGGTTLLMSGMTSAAQQMFSYGGKVYFFASTATSSGLWATDGTAAGTSLIAPLSWVAKPSFASAGSKLFFFAIDQNNSFYESLYEYNPTTSAATELGGQFFGSGYIGAGLSNGKVIFVDPSGYQIWSTDGTAANTQVISSSIGASYRGIYGSPQSNWTALGNTAIFRGYSGATTDLYITDGTAGGTHAVSIGGNAHANVQPQYLVNFGGKVYFSGTDLAHGFELWSTDGTTAGLAVDLNTAPAGSIPDIHANNGSTLYFDATDATNGREPWVSDGTAAGTHLLAAIPNFLGSSGYVSAAGKEYFDAYASVTALYQTDGTAAGTVPFAPAGLTLSNPSYASLNNVLYFSASDATHGSELFKYNGTSASLVTDLNPGTGSSSPAGLLAANGKLFFIASATGAGQPQLFASDGTAAGTAQLSSFTTASTILNYTAILNNKLYFIISVASGAGIGMQLWQTNGTAAGTSMVKQLSNTVATRAWMVSTGATLYLIVDTETSGYISSIFKSDGTTAGTTLLQSSVSLRGIGSVFPSGNNAFFIGSNGVNQQAFQISPTAVQALTPTNVGARFLTATSSAAYFAVTQTSGLAEQIWRSDGTPAGTGVVGTVTIGSAYGDNLYAVGNVLYLSANDGVHGDELMEIDFTDTYTGTSGADAITLVQDVDHTHIDWTAGAQSGKALINAPDGITINGVGGSDTLTLLATNGNPIPNNLHLRGTFTISGLTGTNPLANSKLDIENSTLYIKYASAAADPITVISGYLKNGYNSGLWNGTATSTTGVITSTDAAAAVKRNMGIGYADSKDGIVTLPANTIELKYTLFGDTGLAGTVGFSDFTRMTQHYTQTGMTWLRGDFNYDGTVNAADFALLQPNYGQSLPAPAPLPPVESPAAAAVLDPTPPVDHLAKKARKLHKITKR